ncbi:MAG: hypothetical protein IGQ45_00270 [Cyanobacterium sp. T60_A2020_053]|nr:hypothetical protein [Cyanobacterium sp. T60_A2020_053]
MNYRLKGSLIKNIASAFMNGLITLTLLLIAPLGLASVITNTIAISISTFVVTMAFDVVALWLQQSPYLDRPLEREFSQKLRENHPNLKRRDD